MKGLPSLKTHHLLLGAIAAILIWLVACGGQLPASLGGGALGTGPDPGGGTAPPACSAAQAAPAPDASPDHGCRSSGDDGTGSRHRHGHHGHHHHGCGCRGHLHGHRHRHSDDASTAGEGHEAGARHDRVTACALAAPARV